MHRFLSIVILATSACGTVGLDPCASDADLVTLEAPTSAGSAEDLLALAEGQEELMLSGPAFGSVGMVLGVTWTGQMAAWERSDEDTSYVCYDELHVPVDVALRTDGTELDEAWNVQLSATEPGMAVLTHEVSVDALKGNWRPDADHLVDLRLRVRIVWTEDGSEGVLTAVGTPADGGPDEVWDVAVWPG